MAVRVITGRIGGEKDAHTSPLYERDKPLKNKQFLLQSRRHELCISLTVKTKKTRVNAALIRFLSIFSDLYLSLYGNNLLV